MFLSIFGCIISYFTIYVLFVIQILLNHLFYNKKTDIFVKNDMLKILDFMDNMSDLKGNLRRFYS